MGNKKNIDKLFQDQFKSFEAVPDDAMWDAIQDKLDENNSNKKRMPIWMMFSSIAAILVVFVALSISLSSENESTEKVVIALENKELFRKDKYASEEKEVRVLSPVNYGSGNIIDSGFKGNKSNAVFTGVVAFENVKVGLLEETENALKSVVLVSKKSKASNSNSINKNYKTQPVKSDNILNINGGLGERNSDEIALENTKSVGLNDDENVKNNNQSGLKESVLSSSGELMTVSKNLATQYVTSSTSEASVENKDIHEVLGQNINVIDARFVVGKSAVTSGNFQGGSLVNNPKIESDIVLAKAEGHVGSDDDVVELVDDGNSEGLNLSKDTNEEEECIDEEIEKPLEKTIEDAIAELEGKQENEDDEEVEFAFGKWEIAPSIAPVYYNTLSSGSPINSELSGNKKTGKINMSYGLGVGYSINKKLTLRTGINKVSLGFDTEDVAVNRNSETINGTRGVGNINLSPAAASLNIASSESFSIAQIPSSYTSLYNSSLNQRLGYLEVPLELSYKVSNKKMKIDVIAGMSTFFLNENDIYTETNGVESHIGEANNLNKISYSTNVGIGFNYKISKAFNFNFEPMFKYQLNAFSNDSGSFKPYILGVYTGFSFKF